MALIGTIRKNFWFVLILLGLALAAFVIMDMTSASNRAGAGNLTMGEVAGTKIDYADFQRTEQSYFRGAGDQYAKKKTIWDFYVEKALVDKEADALGMTVSQDELMDLQFGDNLSPVVTQNWTNPQTRQVDRAQLNSFRTAIENGEELNPQFRAYWAEQEKHLVKEQKTSKLQNMVTKGFYTPKWMAESLYNDENTTVDFNYVKIPFDAINEEVEVTDSAIKDYMNTHVADFKTDEETRVIEYVVFDVVPSAQDSAAIVKSLNEMKPKFANAENDSLYAAVNQGGYSNYYFRSSQLPAVAKESIENLAVGSVYGPYLDQGTYSMVKMIDKKVVPDTVEARHILKKCDRNNAVDLARARKSIDSLRNVIRTGKSDFASVAKANSEDPGSAAKGGDLGEFVQGTMVPEFNAVCFETGRTGNLYTVTSQFGVHLIEILDQTYTDRDNKYKIATIVKPIIPSEETQSAVYDMAADYVSENRNVESLKSAVGNKGRVAISNAVARNDYAIQNLESGQTSRDMISWVFDPSTEVGDVSPDVFDFRADGQYYDNKYVVASLKSIEQAGMPSVAVGRQRAENIVRNRLKGQKLANSLSVSDLNSLASQYDTQIGNVADANGKVGFLKGVGTEPEVVAAAMSTQIQGLSKPIVGNSGVFVVQTLSKQDPDMSSVNYNLVRQNQARSTANQAGLKLLNSLRDNADIEDGRQKFF